MSSRHPFYLPALLAVLAVIGACAPSYAQDASGAAAVVAEYVAGELKAGTIDEFCKETRRLVQLVDDYPDCPPHDEANLILNLPSIKCVAVSSAAATCSLKYAIVAHWEPFTHKPITLVKRAENKTLRLSLKPEGWQIDEPYALPHLGAPAVAQYLQSELTRLAKKPYLPPETGGYIEKTRISLKRLGLLHGVKP